MSTIPLAVVLIPFVLFLLLFFVFSIFNLFHVIHYGISTVGKFIIIAIYTAGTLFLLGGSYIVLAEYDWQQPISSTSFIDSAADTNLFELPNVPLREFEEEGL